MKINREKLLNLLELAEPGLASREIIEQSTCFVFKDGLLTTFNDEIACQQKTKLKIKGAIQAKPLLALLRKMTDVKIEIDAVGDSFQIKGRRKGAKIAMDKKIQLPIDEIETPKNWINLKDDFYDTIKMLRACASTDESTFKLTCIHITPKYMEAMDNYQAIRVKIKLNIRKNLLVRSDSLNQAARLNISQMSETKRWLHFKTPNGLIFSCRKYLEEYHDLDEMLNIKGKKIKLPKGLKDAAEKAQIFSDTNAESTNILVEIRSNKLRLTGTGTEGKYWEFKNINYSGPAMEFQISPQLLSNIVTSYQECEITPDRLKAKGPNFTYIAALNKINDEKDE